MQELQSPVAVVGRLRLERDGLLYPVGGRLAEKGVTLGYLIERRRIVNPSQVRQTFELLSRFIGSEASIVVGNADGLAWSDLSNAVTGCTLIGRASIGAGIRPRRHPACVCWAKAIDLTPWMVAVEFPRAVVLAPAERLARVSRGSPCAAVDGGAFRRAISYALRCRYGA